MPNLSAVSRSRSRPLSLFFFASGTPSPKRCLPYIVLHGLIWLQGADGVLLCGGEGGEGWIVVDVRLSLESPLVGSCKLIVAGVSTVLAGVGVSLGALDLVVESTVE